MALTPGTRLGPHEILSAIGSGGMGEVYKARDTRLDRTVAIKVLPAHLSADLERRQRLEREARVISSLNHPNICTLYDIGHDGDLFFVVMEYVDGESLADRLARGPLPLDQALARGMEIADALSQAHRQGVVHRDLKPANVMITKSGAKLLDFGLAKIAGNHPQNPDLSPTLTKPLTDAGTVLGTVQYMAPEQLEGLEADTRSDIFAFGSLLYEMLTGKRTFEARSQASLISAILKDDPAPLLPLAPLTPPALERLVRVALAKEPDARWQSAQDLASQLRWIAESGSQSGVVLPQRIGGASRERLLWASLVAALTVAILVLALPYIRRTPAPVAPMVRFTVGPPEGVLFGTEQVAPFPAISPDGNHIVFQAPGPAGDTLWIQSLDAVAPRRLAAAQTGVQPFWSPEGRSIGFFDVEDNSLKRLDLAGGAPQTVWHGASLLPSSGLVQSATWGPDGSIVFATGEGLYRVPFTGGLPAQLTQVDRSRERAHSHPSFLPDGRHFLYWSGSTKGNSIWLGSMDSKDSRRLFDADSKAVYADPGYVLFVRQNILFAQRFDPDRFETSGDPVAIAEDVRTNVGNGRSAFTTSQNGTLVYRPGSVEQNRVLAWYDRDGQKLTTIADSLGDHRGLALSPNDNQVISHIHDDTQGGGSLWLIDLDRGTKQRVTTGVYHDASPVWSPDGTQVAFSSDRAGSTDLFRTRANGVGEPEPWLKSAEVKSPSDWSRSWMIYSVITPQRRRDIWYFPTGENPKPRPYLQGESDELYGRLSPDEKWMAYQSDETGEMEIYIRPFPDANADKVRVSRNGGVCPIWRDDGKALFWLTIVPGTSPNVLTSVPLTFTNGVMRAGEPVDLFPVPLSGFRTYVGGGIGGGSANIAVTRNGQRFLGDVSANDAALPQAPMTVILNWTSLMTGK